jgi:hypothetical protein
MKFIKIKIDVAGNNITSGKTGVIDANQEFKETKVDEQDNTRNRYCF